MVKPILSILLGSDDRSMDVKSLRKMVLSSLQSEDKKQYKRTIQSLESQESVALDADGVVRLTKAGKKLASSDGQEKKKKKKKKDRRRRAEEDDDADDAPTPSKRPKVVADDVADDEDDDGAIPADPSVKHRPVPGNRDGVTRLFVGNLAFAIDEKALAEAIGPVTHVKWITDKETGRFYGSAFVEMADSAAAAKAVNMAGEKVMGRPVKVSFAPALAGTPWPPKNSVVTGNERNDGGEGQ
eukprot:CAMPEP_0113316314 /NCGR_PEP_ID=MMETSP0010_2-20120614/11636_1 /TAXON_ID=216773 ORGANISM="Corethron hystrix, Strain 308" /NCGR_SAMPLE_ID=MMETSP0010_2 /ASSEMBLY_ACC=CAM_ASM_000155 /LENGTH=240 /DNA_ID=CAMNT_0000172999 /DNA_START=38 /DNA_END=757 /DNA_ORIENTATION=- /assembly_acc=CAM_ASM_000155